MSLEQVGSDRSCFYVTPRRRKRRRGESRSFAKDLISDPVLRVTAEACMLLQRPNVQIGQVDPIDDSLKSLALLPWTLYDRRSVSSLFDVVFHHAWMSHEVHRFKILLAKHSERGGFDNVRFDRIGRGMERKTAHQCASFFFNNARSCLSPNRRRVRRGLKQFMECSCCRRECPRFARASNASSLSASPPTSSSEEGGAGGVDEEDVVRAVLERLVIRVEEEATTTAITTTATIAGTSNRTDTLIAVECMMKCGEGLCRDCLRERGDWVLSPRGGEDWGVMSNVKLNNQHQTC